MKKFKLAPQGYFSLLFLICLLALSLWILSANLWVNRAFFIDDSFIGFQYSSNLAKGYGLVWNRGDPPSEGYSNFLSILITSLFLGNNFDPVLITKIIGVVSVLATAFFLYKICIFAGVSQAAGILAACVYISQPAVARHAVSGFETNLYTALLAFLFLYAVRTRVKNGFKNGIILLIAYLLAILSRTEGALFASLMLISLTFYKDRVNFTKNRMFIRYLAASFVIGGLYFLWKLFYFKTLITLPMLIKSSHSPFFCLPGKPELAIFIFSHATIFLFALFGLAISYHKSGLARHAAFLSSSIFVVYLFNCHITAFEGRYFMPSLLFVLILAAYSFDFLLSKFSSKRARAFFMLSCILLITPSNIYLSGLNFLQIRKFFFQAREKIPESWVDIDIKIGKQLGKIDNDNPVVIVTEDVGAMAFYSGKTIIDPVGVTNASIAHSKNAAEYLDTIFSYVPDIFLLRTDRLVQDLIEYPVEDAPVEPCGVCCRSCQWGQLEHFGKSAIYADKRFKQEYVFIGRMLDSNEKESEYYWNFWLRKNSPSFSQLQDATKALFVEQDFRF